MSLLNSIFPPVLHTGAMFCRTRLLSCQGYTILGGQDDDPLRKMYRFYSVLHLLSLKVPVRYRESAPWFSACLVLCLCRICLPLEVCQSCSHEFSGLTQPLLELLGTVAQVCALSGGENFEKQLQFKEFPGGC